MDDRVSGAVRGSHVDQPDLRPADVQDRLAFEHPVREDGSDIAVVEAGEDPAGEPSGVAVLGKQRPYLGRARLAHVGE